MGETGGGEEWVTANTGRVVTVRVGHADLARTLDGSNWGKVHGNTEAHILLQRHPDINSSSQFNHNRLIVRDPSSTGTIQDTLIYHSLSQELSCTVVFVADADMLLLLAKDNTNYVATPAELTTTSSLQHV